MPNSSTIDHEGVIIAIKEDALKVLLKPISACGSCEARGTCPVIEESTGKTVDVAGAGTQHQVGDKVVVTMESGQGRWAVFLAYILPFFLIFAVLVIGNYLVDNEIVAGIAAIGVLVPYFMTLYVLRGRMKKIFVFRLQEESSI